MNPMKTIQIDKVTVNFGAGKDQKRLENGITLIKMVTGLDPIKTITQARIPTWGLRPGLPIGAKITLRGEQAQEVAARFFTARNNKVASSCVDNQGNVSFGVAEYVDIPGVKYDPKIGVLGLQISITLKRPGFRVQRRKLQTTQVGSSHKIRQEEAQKFLTEKFGVVFE
ncbi:MAG: 50S ribosomal protein L5 [Candidatus Woesearchaeota archaeon]